MTLLSPGEVCKKLNIQPSTLRKYSLLFEKEQIIFSRNKNNARLYTVTELAALQKVVTTMKSGQETLENAVIKASKDLKGGNTVAVNNAVTGTIPERHNDDIATVTLEEVRSLKEEIKKRDALFVEVLESLQSEIRTMKQQQEQLTGQLSERKQLEATEQPSQEAVPVIEPIKEPEPIKKSFLQRIFKR